MPRKAKKQMHRMPPLSFVDKTIYWLIFLLLCIADFLLIMGPLYFRHTVPFSDRSVAAVEDNISICWLCVPWMTFFLMTFILWLQPYQNRKPIFGKRNFKYGPPAWPKEYPLFMKNKPYVFVSERKKKERKQISALLLVILLISFIPLPWSLYGRDCLRYDGSIVQYNMFNKEVHNYSSGEIENIIIKACRYRTGKSSKKSHWGVRMVFTTNSGKKYVFAQSEFRDDFKSDHQLWLETMLKVKQRYDPYVISYEGIENLDRVIEDCNLSAKDIQLLYQLFGQ